MSERIRRYIDELFADAPQTRKAMDLKEELAINTIEKYQDLISEGYSEEDAWQMVIGSIGDVTELFEALKEENPLQLSEEDRKKKATLKAAAIGIYIFAGAVFLTGTALADHMLPYMAYDMVIRLGIVMAALFCIPPTCMLVYAANMYPDYTKRADNMVERYRKANFAKNREKAVRFTVSMNIWLVTLTCYFIISFVSGQWGVTWITFLIGACVQAGVLLRFALEQDNERDGGN